MTAASVEQLHNVDMKNTDLRFLRADDHLVVVVAHPDDETFGCGSLIAMAAARGARVSVVCATRGEAGEPTAHTDLTTRSLGEVRESELRAAARLLGASHVEVLDFLDSGFDGPCAEGSLCATDITTVSRLLGTIFDRLQPTVVLTVDGSDGHRDHVHLRDAIAGALAAAPAPQRARLYMSTLPNSVMRRWLDEKLASGESSAYHAIDPDLIGRPDDQVSFTVDSREMLDTRLAAIALHGSQKSPFDGLSVQLRDLFLATDHVVEG